MKQQLVKFYATGDGHGALERDVNSDIAKQATAGFTVATVNISTMGAAMTAAVLYEKQVEVARR